MPAIGLISDTHSYLDPQVFEYFKEVDEIWHIGDVGDAQLLDKLRAFKPLRGVYGNIDDREIRQELPLDYRFVMEDMDIWMTHIGGYPGKYTSRVRDILQIKAPDLFICGHSHILKVMRDKKYNMLCMNPGAAGKHGFHKLRTLLRFHIKNKTLSNLEVIELGTR
ncbi:MAG: metallophosphoesterase family protein [Chitinophagales bacterium]|nr:metallophosphoesterase family protein [Chitinophagales bacterium]|tara:strand:+ start:963 stop:1457 length:495 start_codon:yes stop_codon:yes gene_type:complete